MPASPTCATSSAPSLSSAPRPRRTLPPLETTTTSSLSVHVSREQTWRVLTERAGSSKPIFYRSRLGLTQLSSLAELGPQLRRRFIFSRRKQGFCKSSLSRGWGSSSLKVHEFVVRNSRLEAEGPDEVGGPTVVERKNESWVSFACHDLHFFGHRGVEGAGLPQEVLFLPKASQKVVDRAPSKEVNRERRCRTREVSCASYHSVKMCVPLSSRTSSLAVAELVKAAKIASISASISGASAWERPRYKLNRRYVGNAVISAVQSNKRKDEIEKKKTSSRISKTK